MDDKYLSPFYAQFESAMEFVLKYRIGKDGNCPALNEAGEASTDSNLDQEDWDIEAVDLGGGKYLLASVSMAPFSNLSLHWGDEFFADPAGANALTLVSVVFPKKYEHFGVITSGPFSNADLSAKIVHELGGGWETVAGGMLTLTVPVSRVAEFHEMHRQQQHLPGVLLFKP